MVENSEFDTVYHEHFSYLSLIVVERIFRSAGLRLIDVEELPTHGHSLRVYGCLGDRSPGRHGPAVARLLDGGARRRASTPPTFYDGFQTPGQRGSRTIFWRFPPRRAMREGKTVVIGYGAAAKGNDAPELCRNPPRPDPGGLRCGVVQAGQVSAGQPHQIER
jgi:hypothetical protein